MRQNRKGEFVVVYHADALVIRSRELGESDRVLTLFSRERGKLQAVAKGVRKPKSRQRAGAQLFTYGNFLIYKGKALDTISQCSAKESFPHLWNDLDRSFTAAGMVELLDSSTVVGQPNQELFTLTLTCLFLLEQFQPSLVLCAYALRLTSLLGYRPRLGECAECGAKASEERLFFSPDAGGILCENCRKNFFGRWISAGSAAFMRQLSDAEITKIDRLRWNLQMKKEIIENIKFFLEYRLERPLKSWRMSSMLGSDFRQHIGGKE